MKAARVPRVRRFKMPRWLRHRGILRLRRLPSPEKFQRLRRDCSRYDALMYETPLRSVQGLPKIAAAALFKH
jgi:hypothetical protein